MAQIAAERYTGASIKRSDFGIGAYVPNVSDEISIRITTEGAVPKADDAAK